MKKTERFSDRKIIVSVDFVLKIFRSSNFPVKVLWLGTLHLLDWANCSGTGGIRLPIVYESAAPFESLISQANDLQQLQRIRRLSNARFHLVIKRHRFLAILFNKLLTKVNRLASFG